jgi:tRNA-splicing ligase RtcB (3'-phosphate/5'-hydroxy nucleic acid ligase)
VVHAALGLARRGQRIGTMFIELAKQDAMRQTANLPDRTSPTSRKAAALRRLRARVGWAQRLARANREVMMKRVIGAAKTRCRAVPEPRGSGELPPQLRAAGAPLRRGRVRHPQGRGARGPGAGHHPRQHGRAQLIVRGKGNPESFCSCSHGAGRAMSRTRPSAASRSDHRAATEGVECRKDKDVIDETPAAYKDIDAVMAAQRPGRGGAHAEAGGVREGQPSRSSTSPP